jgi:hypothetical protein
MRVSGFGSTNWTLARMDQVKRLTIILALYMTAGAQDKPYWTATAAAAASTAWDGLTTANFKSACQETWTPWLYGKHPEPARVALTMTAEFAGSAILAHELRKHHRRWWAAPLVWTGGNHLRGAIHNTRSYCQ